MINKLSALDTGWTWGQTYNLFLCVLVGAEEVDSLHVTKINIMAQEKDEQQLADVLLFTVAI